MIWIWEFQVFWQIESNWPVRLSNFGWTWEPIGSHGPHLSHSKLQGIMDSRPNGPNDAQCTSQEQPRIFQKKICRKIIRIQIVLKQPECFVLSQPVNRAVPFRAVVTPPTPAPAAASKVVAEAWAMTRSFPSVIEKVEAGLNAKNPTNLRKSHAEIKSLESNETKKKWITGLYWIAGDGMIYVYLDGLWLTRYLIIKSLVVRFRCWRMNLRLEIWA